MTFKTFIKAMCIVGVGCALFSVASIAWAQVPGKIKPKAPPKEDKIPPDLAPDKVDSYLAGITDEQARKLLAAELKKKAASKSGKGTGELLGEKDSGFVAGFYAVQGALTTLFDRLSGIVATAPASAAPDAWEKAAGGNRPSQIVTGMVLLVFIILLGWAAERLLVRRAEKLRGHLIEEAPHSGWGKAGIFVSRLIFNLAGFGVYVLVTFTAHFILFEQRQTAYLVSSTIIVTYYFRLVEMAARLIVSPKDPELRLVQMSDLDARFIYNWITGITLALIPAAALALALEKAGASRELFLFVYSSAGPVMGILLSVMIWQARHRVARLICPPGEPGAGSAWVLRQRWADYWHYPVILFVLAVGGYWWARVLIHADATILRLILSLFLVPLCIGLDQWLQQILTRLEGTRKEVIDFSTTDEGGETRPERLLGRSSDLRGRVSAKDVSVYFPLIRKIFRTVLLFFLVSAVLTLWGIEFDPGWLFARNVLGVVIALVLGLLVWEVVKARIDQRIKEEMPPLGDEAEEGGSGGSRSGTLLLLLRKFILVFLFVVVGFSVLASLGVNIAPLLAGASVVGLAIGFGSQTLVKDIISGIFFLVDDAFRVGDYVEAGAAKGTVEQISLRSVRLRHPRGQVFVVPFGDLKMVQNFTRDYIIEKLDIRVRFDTSPDAIRKIVKKINKEIREDEEYANVLLSDIKSVGVRSMDDSAMIMRVKFKCLPGEQFVLRREVFHRIQKAFKEKGIEFAHRNVTVYLPPQQPAGAGAESPGGGSPSLEAAGAAAAAALAQAEAEALAQAPAKKKQP